LIVVAVEMFISTKTSYILRSTTCGKSPSFLGVIGKGCGEQQGVSFTDRLLPLFSQIGYNVPSITAVNY
jgi:hypothetical protein